MYGTTKMAIGVLPVGGGTQWGNAEKQGDTSFTFRFKFASHASAQWSSTLDSFATYQGQAFSSTRIFRSITAPLLS